MGQFYGAWFSRKLVEKIKALSPTLVCVGGDLYDGAMVDKELVIEPFKKLVPPLGLYFITGNHEEFEDTQKYISVIKEVGMRVLNNEKVDIDGLQLVGVDYKDTVKKKAYTKIMESLALDRQKPSILLKHTPRDMEVAERAGISLQISGHTHKAQMYPLSYITRALYKGFDYGLKKFGTMSVYTSSGVGSWGPPMRVGSRAEIVEIHFI